MSDADLLTLTQWLSPAFPVGGYAYSHGLEQAVSSGEVTDAEGVFGWLAAVVEHGSGLSDAVLLCAALAPGADHADLSEIARALAPSKERDRETMDQGRAFTEATNALTQMSFPPAPLPVAVGRAAAALTLPPERIAALYLHAFAANLAGAATRFVPLGQTDGQRVVARLHPIIERTAARAVTLTPDDIASSVPAADLASMLHETQDVRIFRT